MPCDLAPPLPLKTPRSPPTHRAEAAPSRAWTAAAIGLCTGVFLATWPGAARADSENLTELDLARLAVAEMRVTTDTPSGKVTDLPVSVPSLKHGQLILKARPHANDVDALLIDPQTIVTRDGRVEFNAVERHFVASAGAREQTYGVSAKVSVECRSRRFSYIAAMAFDYARDEAPLAFTGNGGAVPRNLFGKDIATLLCGLRGFPYVELWDHHFRQLRTVPENALLPEELWHVHIDERRQIQRFSESPLLKFLRRWNKRFADFRNAPGHGQFPANKLSTAHSDARPSRLT